jgi:hypothetical protein
VEINTGISNNNAIITVNSYYTFLYRDPDWQHRYASCGYEILQLEINTRIESIIH